MLMPGRKYSAGTVYRYGFNGKEEDKDISGSNYDFGERIYSARIGRWLTTDAINKPHLSAYQACANNPVNFIDPDGEDEIHFLKKREVYTNSFNNEVVVSETLQILIIKSEGPDRFFYKQVDRVMTPKYPTPTQWYQTNLGPPTLIYDHTSVGKNIELCPFDGGKHGVTRSSIGVWPLGFLTLPDWDNTTLQKYMYASPQLVDYIETRGLTGIKKNDDGWNDALNHYQLNGILDEALQITSFIADVTTFLTTFAKVPGSIGDEMLSIESGAGGVTAPMKMVRMLSKGEKIEDIVNEGKALTWETGNEHAVVKLANGERALVSGGPGGISFKTGEIEKIFGHTHPTSAGPSSADFNALKELGQTKQYVFHGGEITVVKTQ